MGYLNFPDHQIVAAMFIEIENGFQLQEKRDFEKYVVLPENVD